MINYIGFKYLQPPPLPPNHVHRQILLDEIATRLLQATTDPWMYGITLTITGSSGFGKTTAAISLCHYPVVNKHFTDGFVFIELGLQATDPSIKLRDIYNLLTGEQCSVNVVEKINKLTSNYYHNLLVIIDDVWRVEDAEPLVMAFSNCKIILTTKMNGIQQYIPSEQSLYVGPMTQHEAITLLTIGVIDSSQLSQEDVTLLDELAQAVHLWPLLLCLIRGQLSHYLKQYCLSYHKAIYNVQAKLHHKGLTAFDKNNIEPINKSRKLAVKACIEVILELLTKSLSDKLKSLILYNEISSSLQIAVLNNLWDSKQVLNNLWDVSKQEADRTVVALWAYGLVQVTDTVSPNYIRQHSVEVHDVISQYVIECMDSYEVYTLLPYGKLNTLYSVITTLFQKSYGVYDPSSLTVVDYLKYKLSEFSNCYVPSCLQAIKRNIVTDPHTIIMILQHVKDALIGSPYTIYLSSLHDVDDHCKRLMRGTRILCRKIIQRAQKNLFEQDYDELLQTLQEFIKNYPLHSVAQEAVIIIQKIIPYCDSELLHYMTETCESLMLLTLDYHDMTVSLLPHIKLYVKLHKQISESLLKGSPDIELIYNYIMSGKFSEEIELINVSKFIKLQGVAYRLVSMMGRLL